MTTASSRSSEVSIEELGADEESVQKEESAERLNTGEAQPDEQNKEEVEESAVAVAAAAVAAALDQTADHADDEDEEEDEDDFDDETVLERVFGLTEMFPESLRNGTCAVASGSVSCAKWLLGASKTVAWVAFSSSAVLFLPIMIETERMGIEEAEKQQQRQILLGPGAAISGTS